MVIFTEKRKKKKKKEKNQYPLNRRPARASMKFWRREKSLAPTKILSPECPGVA